MKYIQKKYIFLAYIKKKCYLCARNTNKENKFQLNIINYLKISYYDSHNIQPIERSEG